MSSVPPPSFQHPGPPPSRPELPDGVDRPEPPAPDPFPRWPLWSPVAILLVAIVASAIAYGLIAAIAGLDGDEAADAPGPVIVATLVQGALFIGGAWLLAVRMGVRPAHALGLRRTPLWPAVGKSLLLYVVGFWALSAIVLLLFGDPAEQDITEEIKAERAALAVFGWIAVTAIMAPIAEEVLFRGVLFPALATRLGVIAGAVLSGALFSLVHALGSPVEALIVLFGLGTGLAFLYVWTGSILPCIGVHAFNNAISLAVAREMEAAAAVATIVGSVVVSVLIAYSLATTRSRTVPA